MTQKDLEFLDKTRKFDEIHSEFKFWNGTQFGIVIAMLLTIGDIKRYCIALGFWLVATTFAAIYQHKSRKVLKEMGKLV